MSPYYVSSPQTMPDDVAAAAPATLPEEHPRDMPPPPVLFLVHVLVVLSSLTICLVNRSKVLMQSNYLGPHSRSLVCAACHTSVYTTEYGTVVGWSLVVKTVEENRRTKRRNCHFDPLHCLSNIYICTNIPTGGEKDPRSFMYGTISINLDTSQPPL